MRNNLTQLKRKLFYIAVIVSTLGHGLNIFMNINGLTFFLDIFTVFCSIIAFVLYKTKTINVNIGNGILIYSIFSNILISTFLYISVAKFDGLLFLSALTSLTMFLYTAFTQTRNQ